MTAQPSASFQLTQQGQLRHFISLDNLPKTLLEQVLDTAAGFIEPDGRSIRKVPLLAGKTVVNLFFENSTRTRNTFELAAKRLSADVLNIDVARSSTSKGETLRDMLWNIRSMGVDLIILRHADSGAAHYVASQVTPDIPVVNAGDGRHEHPTQAMLDMYTLRHFKGDLSKLSVAIVGDILHSRVARSQIIALNTLGCTDIRIVGPRTLLPVEAESLGVSVHHSLEEGIRDVDAIVALRLQKERMDSALIPSESEFSRLYGLTRERLKLANPDAIIMHPGPINRGVEIASQVADGAQSVILQQVTFGIAVRMAVLSLCMSGRAADAALLDRPTEADHA